MTELSEVFEYAYVHSEAGERHIKVEALGEPTEYKYSHSITYELLDTNKQPVPHTERYQTTPIRYSEDQEDMWTDAEYMAWVDANRAAWVADDKLLLCGYTG